MSATPDTSQDPIGPCEPLEQSPTGDALIHGSTAPLRSSLFFGENVLPAKVVVRCWIHASVQRAMSKREISQGFELTQASNISGFTLQCYRGYAPLSTLSASTGSPSKVIRRQRHAFETLTTRSRRHASHERQHQYTPSIRSHYNL